MPITLRSGRSCSRPLIASAYGDGTVRVWNTVTGRAASQDGGGWLIILASVIAIVLSPSAATVTVWKILHASRRAR
jgi:hypothetical protein